MADPTGPGVVDGTVNDDDMAVGFTDAGGDAITDGGDVISASDGDDSVQAGGGDDTVFGGMGSDTLRGGRDDDIIIGDDMSNDYAGSGTPGDDLIAGEGGSDTIFAGDGEDTVYGDYEPGTEPVGTGGSRESFNWSEVGTPSDGDPLGGPFVQDTGTIEVTFTTGGNHGVDTTFEEDPQIVTGIDSGSETVDPNSALRSELDPREAANYILDFSESVEDVQFRINDIDNTSIAKVWAYDAEGNRIEVNATGTATTNLNITDVDGYPGNEAAIAGGGDYAEDDPDNSVLIDIPGPVARVEIVHLNYAGEVSDIDVSDIFFTSPHGGVVNDGAGDLIIGGDDDDMIYGQQGNDTIVGLGGEDFMAGGDDADVFGWFGPGSFVDGSETGFDNDTIYLGGLVDRFVPGGEIRVDFDVPGGEDGTITYIDETGTEVGTTRFVNIENVLDAGVPGVVCFTPGTRILTPMGEVAVENLQPGDKVVTRDNGLQEIRWAGKKRLSGKDLMMQPNLRPILIKQGALGPNQPERDMMVSPNHRMLLVSQQAELLFDEREVLVAAKHLTHLDGVQQIDTVGVEYIHIMCEHHEVVLADGAWSESFQPGEYSIDGIDEDQRSEIYALFPELREREGLEAYTAARHTLKRHEAQLIS